MERKNYGASLYNPAATTVNLAGIVAQVFMEASAIAKRHGSTACSVLFEMRVASEGQGDTKTVLALDRAINIAALDKVFEFRRRGRAEMAPVTELRAAT